MKKLYVFCFSLYSIGFFSQKITLKVLDFDTNTPIEKAHILRRLQKANLINFPSFSAKTSIVQFFSGFKLINAFFRCFLATVLTCCVKTFKKTVF
jgi:hypothetical protein